MLFTLVWQGSDKYRNWTAFKCPSDFQIQFCKDDLLEAFSLLRFFFFLLGGKNSYLYSALLFIDGLLFCNFI